MRKLFILLLILLVPAAVAAIPTGKLEYKATKPKAANAKIIEKGIDGAVEDMSFITKPIARSRLEKSNIAFETITIEVKGSKVSIIHDGRKPVTSPKDGSKVKWTREDGETFDVSQKVSDDKIVQIFFADDGKKTLTYDFGDDPSTMTVSVVVESPKLSGPLKYSLDYKQ